MIHVRMVVLPLLVLAWAPWFPASAQSVVSTHSGLIYFFDGSVFLGDEPLEQKFGKFPELGEGRELRTGHGRAEVLLTPGVFLRIDGNSAIRMLSNQLSDTRVELVAGSAILEANDAVANTSVRLIYKDWQMRVPQKGVYRIASDPPQLAVYKGKVEVATEGKTDTVAVKEGEVLPFAPVLLAEQSTAAGGDPFKDWAMSRSQAISADNAIAAGIVDDPSQIASSSLAWGGFSYFPLTGIPSLGITHPYGLSFWSPYQSALSAIYYPVYTYGWQTHGWPGAVALYPRQPLMPSPIGTGLHPVGVTSPRPFTPLPRPSPGTPPRAPAPHMGIRGGGRR